MRFTLKPQRRTMFAVALALLVSVSEGGSRGRAQADPPTPPHILVITADDLDVQTAEIMVALGLLPNLRQYVLDRGVRLGNAFATSAVASPSRASALTGLYPHNHGVLNNRVEPELGPGGVTAFADSWTLATWLKAAGYRTGHVGKYLNEYGSDPAAPLDSPLNPQYLPPGWDDWQALVDPSTHSVYNYTVNDNGVLVQHGSVPEDHQTSVLAARAAAFIAESRSSFPGQPFFLNVTPLAPHYESFTILLFALDGLQYHDAFAWLMRPDARDATAKPLFWNFIFTQLPLIPSYKPAFNEADVTDKPASLQRPALTPTDSFFLTLKYRTRWATMLGVDDLVGSLAAALGDQFANTVIVFASDNGYLHGEHRMADKLVPYEESIRLPLYVAGPGVVGPRTADALAANNDLAPTILQLAGATPGFALDGRSLVPLLQGPAPAGWRTPLLVEHRTGEGIYDAPTYAAIRTGETDAYPRRLYVEYHGNADDPGAVTDVELYDLTVDPNQLQSLHADPARAAERAALQASLASLATCGSPGQPTCQSQEQ